MQRIDGGRHRDSTIATTARQDRCVHERVLRLDEHQAVATCVWPADAAVGVRCRELWAAESLQCGSAEHPRWGKTGLVQASNGPCGVLAAVQARMIALRLPESDSEQPPAGQKVDEIATGHLVEALATCLEDACPLDGEVKPRRSCVAVPPQLSAQWHLVEAAGQGLREVLTAHVERFGLIALLYSLVCTRGVERVATELRSAGEACLVAGDREALVTGQVGFCTESLLTLVTTGCADGSLDACPAPTSPPTIGITAERGLADFIVGPWLKAPARPVWVLRWGAHYSCVWRHSGCFWHYNGLSVQGGRTFSFVPVVTEQEEKVTHTVGGRRLPLDNAQFACLQQRVEALHSAELLTEVELYILWTTTDMSSESFHLPLHLNEFMIRYICSGQVCRGGSHR